jgi:integrase
MTKLKQNKYVQHSRAEEYTQSSLGRAEQPPDTSREQNDPSTSSRRASGQALTALRVDKLKATGATYYINDAAQPGLSVRVSAGGVKAFVFTKYKHARLTRITLGRVGAMRLDAARRAAQALHGELALGVDVGAERKRARDAAKVETMQEAFDRFLETKARRASTMTDYQYLWRLHVPAGLKRKPVKDVMPADLESIKRALGSKHRTANKVVVLIGALMAKSGRWADNPARGVTRWQEPVRTRRLSMDELARVWAALENEPEWGDFFRLLILTGARRTPFCAMRWRDLDLDTGVWTIPVEWAKSKREMAIPLSGEAVRILRVRRDAKNAAGYDEGESGDYSGSKWVWPTSDEPSTRRGSRASTTGHVVNPEKPWRRALKAARVTERATLHDVRRTLGSRLAMDGVAGATISKVLGHISPQSLKHYAHLDVTAGREAIERAMAGITGSHSAGGLPPE